MSSNFNMSFDPKMKQQFAEIVADYGLTVPQAFKLFANQVIKTKTIPLSFDWLVNSESQLSEKVLLALSQNKLEQEQGKSFKFATFEEMMADLKNA